SCLSGVAFAGPRKGDRLQPIATAVSEWGFWLERYPGAVAYHMFDQYRPIALPTQLNTDAVRSRGTPDLRPQADESIVGVSIGRTAQAYPISVLEKKGLITSDQAGQPVLLLWEPRTQTASAFRPVASQPRKYNGPRPDAHGVSPADAGIPVPPG